MVSTPLRMENPVRRPIVPPIRANWASIVTFRLFPRSAFKYVVVKNLLVSYNLIIGCCVKIDVNCL